MHLQHIVHHGVPKPVKLFGPLESSELRIKVRIVAITAVVGTVDDVFSVGANLALRALVTARHRREVGHHLQYCHCQKKADVVAKTLRSLSTSS